MPPKFGYVLKHYDNDLSLNPELLENRTRNLENIGFDSVWITDHILLPKGSKLPKYEKITELITTLAYLAGKTENINLGFSTLVLPARNTILTAKQISTLHYFMGSRLITSFGAGWADSEFNLLNKDFTNRGARFNEQLEVLRILFNGESEFHGNFHTIENAELSPRRDGLAELPFYIAGNSKAAFHRAETYGNGWHPINISADKISAFVDESDKLSGKDIILRLTASEEPIEETVQRYMDLGIDYFVFHDDGDLKKFERIIQYVRSFQEFQP